MTFVAQIERRSNRPQGELTTAMHAGEERPSVDAVGKNPPRFMGVPSLLADTRP